MSDEQFDPGGRFQVVDHIKRPGWDGPGLIRSMWVGHTAESALKLASELEPVGEHAVAVRAYDRETTRWLDDGSPAFKHEQTPEEQLTTISDRVGQLSIDVRVLAGRAEEVASYASYGGTEPQINALLSVARELRCVAVEIEALR